MKLPALANPQPYVGLYVLELDGQTAVGYTADEVAALLESESARIERIFRIHRALPDGQMELVGIHPTRFQLESGLFFYRAGEAAARHDFQALLDLAADTPLPTRASVQLARLAGNPAGEFCVAVIYPAEHDETMAQWMDECGFEGGETVEGGIGAVSDFRQAAWTVLERRPLLPATRDDALAPRSRDTLLASLGQPLQRRLA